MGWRVTTSHDTVRTLCEVMSQPSAESKEGHGHAEMSVTDIPGREYH